MKRRYVLIGLAMIAAVAIASPVFGLPASIKKAIKKEVTKQVSSATGPAGATGAPGAAGAAGSARGFARVRPHDDEACAPNCDVQDDSGNVTVTRSGIGVYCVVVAGVSAEDVSAVVSVDFGPAIDPEGNNSVMTDRRCGTTGFEVHAERQNSIAVEDDPAPDGSTAVAGNAVPDDNVGFNIIVP